MKNSRKRKIKGQFSVIDEFTSEEKHRLHPNPDLTKEIIEKINKKTLLADIVQISSTETTASELTMLDNKKEQPISVNLDLNTSSEKILEPDQKYLQNESEVQTGFKLGADYTLLQFSPLQILVLNFFYKICEMTRSSNTPPIKISDIVSHCNCTKNGAKSAIKVLLKSKIITRIYHKDGRSGWSQYNIPDATHNMMLLNQKLGSNWVQTGFKLGVNPSSRNEIETNSTYLPESERVNQSNVSNNSVDDFDPSEINLTEVAKFGVKIKQLYDIKNQKLPLSTYQVQTLVDKFAIFASDQKNSNIQSFPGIFVRSAQKLSKGEDIFADIETPEDTLIKQRIEALALQKKKKEETQNQLFELEFQNWLETKNQEQRDILVPPSHVISSGGFSQAIMLREHFKINYFPKILEGMSSALR